MNKQLYKGGLILITYTMYKIYYKCISYFDGYVIKCTCMYYIFNLHNIYMSIENGTNGQPPRGGAGANIM